MRLLNLTRRHDNAFGTLPIFVAKFNGSFRKLKGPIEKVTASCRHDSRRAIYYMNVVFHLDDCQLIFAGSKGQQLIILGENLLYILQNHANDQELDVACIRPVIR